MAAPREPDSAKVEAFMEKALGDLSGAMATALCAIGDRLGLFKDLAAHGPTRSQDLADRLDLRERYVREWLRGLTAAGYLTEPEPGTFALPPNTSPHSPPNRARCSWAASTRCSPASGSPTNNSWTPSGRAAAYRRPPTRPPSGTA